ncbi:MAG: CRISPR-associated endonuclease Cas2 [Candidatus Nezhaarchaeales archaeon]|uniref:CRISPR-associated endonuclease Cas2 n=1 Tax=Thermofilum sp. TaxID=1961369 RepID=UPI001201179F|nr:MAG: CRISPR-associated endonuclease Cas2 [Candidatus Nezhaarchaeota archaeon WYZ-LMO7]
MQYILVYDVSEDDVRNKLRRLLEDYGAKRIQYSAFTAELEEPQLMEIMQKAERLLRGVNGSLIAIPVCSKDESKRISIGRRMEETTVF